MEKLSRRREKKAVRVMRYGVVCGLLAAGLCAAPAGAEEGAPAKQPETTIAELARENGLLKEQIRQFECTPLIGSEALAAKNYERLRGIAADVKAQRQTMAEFAGFVTWMTTNLSGYAKYVEAGSVAAGFARLLPIPYAGQASVLSKFVSQGILSLKAASVAITSYLGTSQQFVTRVEAIDPALPQNRAEISALAAFADGALLRDVTDVRQKLATAAEVSASTLSFLESLHHYIGSTDAYWNKTKSVLTRKEADQKEKGFLAESIQHLKNRAGDFNARLKSFDETAAKDGPLIKSVIAYDELVRELDARAVAKK
jgi:hypothetical protein